MFLVRTAFTGSGRLTVIRACLTGIRASMAELLDTQPRREVVVVKATATMLHLGWDAHLAGKPPLGSPCREAPRRGPDRASSVRLDGWGNSPQPSTTPPGTLVPGSGGRDGPGYFPEPSPPRPSPRVREQGVHLWGMRYARTTPTGRRLIAEPVPRGEPDMDRMVALVLHLADCLHAHTPEPVADSMMRTTDHDDHRRHEDPDHRPG